MFCKVFHRYLSKSYLNIILSLCLPSILTTLFNWSKNANTNNNNIQHIAHNKVKQVKRNQTFVGQIKEVDWLTGRLVYTVRLLHFSCQNIPFWPLISIFGNIDKLLPANFVIIIIVVAVVFVGILIWHILDIYKAKVFLHIWNWNSLAAKNYWKFTRPTPFSILEILFNFNYFS